MTRSVVDVSNITIHVEKWKIELHTSFWKENYPFNKHSSITINQSNIRIIYYFRLVCTICSKDQNLIILVFKNVYLMGHVVEKHLVCETVSYISN